MADFLDQAVFVLQFTILKGTDIDNHNVTNSIYRAIVTDGSGKEYCRELSRGLRDPVWNLSQAELYLWPPQFLCLDVVEEECYIDPGPSTGVVVRGRAQIEIPQRLGKDTLRVELARHDGFQTKFAGFAYLTLGLWKMPLWKVLENATRIGLHVPNLMEFLFANAEALGLSSSRLSRVLLTNTDGLSLVKLAERVSDNAEALSLSLPTTRKRRNQHTRGGFPNERNW